MDVEESVAFSNPTLSKSRLRRLRDISAKRRLFDSARQVADVNALHLQMFVLTDAVCNLQASCNAMLQVFMSASIPVSACEDNTLVPTMCPNEDVSMDPGAADLQHEESDQEQTSEVPVVDADAVDTQIILERVSDHIGSLMKKLRGKFPAWPPVKGSTEDAGCEMLHKLCQEDVLKTIGESFMASGASEPAGELLADFEGRISAAVTEGLNQWKSFAQLLDTQRQEKENEKMATKTMSYETVQLKPLMKRDMAQPSKKHKKHKY